MNPLRCCNLFSLRDDDSGATREIEGFNTEDTEITELDSEEAGLKSEILCQSKEFSDCCN
jgi:hypothetical protein